MPKAKKSQSRKETTEMDAPAADEPCREVSFVLDCHGAEHVYLCGDFTNWHPACLQRMGSANARRWEKRLVLPPGRHEYKYVVDAQWLHDPHANENVSNIYGFLNSVLEVKT